ncbi:GlcG/HbpS family heme-binding protein [Gilvimarinus sp. F26214L]|uniref:GlcG/HbpS family heme-binding protein n=1 Tax=Gilvimarinus sp. DZF01 TaxID=3461371 RepID=UPI0040460066
MTDSPTALLVATLCCSALALLGCDSGRTDGERQRSGPAGYQEGESTEMALGEQALGCDELPDTAQLAAWLREVPDEGEAGGLFSGRQEWAAVVNRQGELCAMAVSMDDAAAAWPGSINIAKAKAFTANAFSTDLMPLSTARLYTMSQPGHSLFGAANGNPFKSDCLGTPEDPDRGVGEVCGGVITFGGGLALYKDKTKVGGLGVSGDTPCADHEIAKRIRTAAGLNPPQGQAVDDIQYGIADDPSIYIHPLCPNTWRNGEQIGEESPVKGYRDQ